MSKSEDDGLLLSDLLGTFFVSMVIIILGLLSFSVRLCWRGIPRPRVSVRNRMSLWSLPPVEATLGSPTLDTESPRPQDKTPNGQEVVSVDFSVDSAVHPEDKYNHPQIRIESRVVSLPKGKSIPEFNMGSIF